MKSPARSSDAKLEAVKIERNTRLYPKDFLTGEVMAENHEDPTNFTQKKRVDESWKDSVKKEKEGTFSAYNKTKPVTADPGFTQFITTLGMQALSALGNLPNPSGDEQKTDFSEARYWIDTLRMLSEKTKGNLSQEESEMFQNLLYELQIKFVEKNKPHDV